MKESIFSSTNCHDGAGLNAKKKRKVVMDDVFFVMSIFILFISLITSDVGGHWNRIGTIGGDSRVTVVVVLMALFEVLATRVIALAGHSRELSRVDAAAVHWTRRCGDGH